MTYPVLPKPASDQMRVRPHIADIDLARQGFTWDAVAKELGWLPGGDLNKAYLCIDRHANGPLASKLAMIWEGKGGEEERYTFADLKAETNRIANALAQLGVKKGDRVFLFLDRVPELYFTFFAALKLGAVIGPLFSAFGPDPVRDRLQDSGAAVLVTQPDLLRKVEGILGDLPALKHIVVLRRNTAEQPVANRRCQDYAALVRGASSSFTIVPTSYDDFSVMHYTSGTTGKPKGAVHRHLAILQQYATGKWVLDLHPDDIYWCTADPGWVTGTSYGMLAPWSNGVTQVISQAGFSARGWYQTIQKHRVTVWYTAPTAIRMLMKAGEALPARHDLSSLRHICSVGEPLNPEAVMWGMKAFKQPIHDNWWQTETGAIMIANYASMPVRPGSMGKPLPGVEAAVVDAYGKTTTPGTEGDLALRPGWPSMFQTYWNNRPLYESRFRNGWYITGDRARMDTDGYFWFVGRSDDVINTAGHKVGPFEVESVLLEHPAVAEAAVIGKPDPLAMEIVKAFVALKDGYQPTDELRHSIMQHARARLQSIAPRELEFRPSLPKTRSGKIMRRLLKAQELGLPLGDTSTLEE
ncbi:MAG: acetate--CoA ligase [Dehalococcoidia bacterium]|nr:acetate--CoA ligase [Dehalococcoidia bacterium]